MVKPLAADRRRAVRAKRILSIQYRLMKSKLRRRDADTNWHLSTTHDMSFLGLSFLSDVPFQMEDILELHVVMSGILDIFKGYGQVVRVEKKETGAFYLIAVKFTKNNPMSNKSPRMSTTRIKGKNRIKKLEK